MQSKLHRWIALGAVAGLALGGSTVAAAQTSGARPPINDNYLSSLEFNSPGKRLNRVNTLKWVADTTAATVQSNILFPCGQSNCPSGPPEDTTCKGVSYGKTVWFDFYPDANGTVSIRTSGFDNVITLYRFSRSTLLPDSARRQCAHQSSFPSEQMVAKVKKRTAYTFQVGGVNGSGGPLEVLFDFFPTPPRRLSAEATLKARALSNGVQLLGLSVGTARAAKVTVACGPFCPKQSKTGRVTEQFPRLNGVRMPSGSKLQVFVTAPRSIGVLIQYNIQAGNFSKQTFCTEPGSRKPRRACR